MKKKTYSAPQIEIVKANVETPMMLNVSGGDTGIGSGGNAGENGTPEPDAKGESDWDIW